MRRYTATGIPMDQPFAYPDFLRRAVDAFPELAQEFEDIGPYPTLHVSAFGRRIQEAKGAADWDGYARGIRVVTELWPRADEELSRLLCFTLMKALDFDGARGPIAWDMLPVELQRAWQATRKSLDQLTARPARAKKSKRSR